MTEMTDPPLPVLSVRDLTVQFRVGGTPLTAVDGVSFDLRTREVLALVGESGSGKTQTALALLGLLPHNAKATGSVTLDGREILGAGGVTLTGIRGKSVGFVFQEPMTALNPIFTIGYQIAEVLRFHEGMSRRAAAARVIELLALVEFPEPEVVAAKYPHQLSGGQLQRAVIAQALACDPRVVIADEPTTALDMSVQAGILDLLRQLRDRLGTAVLIISHDMGVVADLADRVLVMRRGKQVEVGGAESLFLDPQAPYTRELLAAIPRIELSGSPVPSTSRPPIVEAVDVNLSYSASRAKSFRAVHELSLQLREGEVVGLVGESGSGKSTIGQAILGLVPVEAGSLRVDGVELRDVPAKELRRLRRRLAIVFQDPGSSLDPRMTIGESISEPMVVAGMMTRAQMDARVAELLDQVRLPASYAVRHPHALSGGQRQRVGIARALALRPRVLVADEPTSALDVSVQAQVLDLFEELQEAYGFACLFISHNLAVVERLSHRIAILHRGRLIESGETGRVLRSPESPYTQRLLDSVPLPDPIAQRERRLARGGT